MAGCAMHGRVDMTRSGLEGFGSGLAEDDEVVIEATGNGMAVLRVLGPFVARVIVANPLQVKAIAHAHDQDRQDRCRGARVAACGRLPARGVGARCGDRASAPAGGAPQPGRAPSHAGEERDPCHPGGAPRPALPACGAVQRARAGLARQAGPAGRRARHDRAALARTGPAGRGPRGARPRDRRSGGRRSSGQAPARHHRRERHGGRRARGGDRRHQALPEPAEAGELLRPEPAGAAVRARARPARPDQQGRPGACPRDCWSRRPGRRRRRRGRCTPSSSASAPGAATRSRRWRRRARWRCSSGTC